MSRGGVSGGGVWISRGGEGEGGPRGVTGGGVNGGVPIVDELKVGLRKRAGMGGRRCRVWAGAGWGGRVRVAGRYCRRVE